MNKRILLTGATGALGYELLTRLRDVVCLVRPKGLQDAFSRIADLVGLRDDVKAVAGDITEKFCGIAPADMTKLRGKIGAIVHCAASISFVDERLSHATNVLGVKNMLNLADELGVHQLHHISTVCVSGDARHWNESSHILSKRNFRNCYEETKSLGEIEIRRWGDCNGRRYTIHRPSILIGREDGTTPTFDAYYGYFAIFPKLVAHLKARSAKGRCLPDGVLYDSRRDMFLLPIVIQASRTARLNVVPINWQADMLVALMAKPHQNRTYHLVNPSPPRVRWVIETSLRELGIEGAVIVDSADEKMRSISQQNAGLRRLQGYVDDVLDQYTPYTSLSTVYSMSDTRQELGEHYRPPREFDEKFVRELLNYARMTNWGSNVHAVA